MFHQLLRIVFHQPQKRSPFSRTTALSSEASTAKVKFRKHLGTRLNRIVFGVRKTTTLEDQKEKFMSKDGNQSNALIKRNNT